MDYLSQSPCGSHRPMRNLCTQRLLISFVAFLVLFSTNSKGVSHALAGNQVSIEEFIDLDEAGPSNVLATHNNDKEIIVSIGQGRLTDSEVLLNDNSNSNNNNNNNNNKNSKNDNDDNGDDDNDIVLDDEDLGGDGGEGGAAAAAAAGSGSGSGSGDFDLEVRDAEAAATVLTPTTATTTKTTTTTTTTKTRKSVKKTKKAEENTLTGNNVMINDKASESKQNQDQKESNQAENKEDIIHGTFVDSDIEMDDVSEDDIDYDADALYDLPGSSPMTSNNIVDPAAWSKWSRWQLVGKSVKVRLRTCQVGGQDVSQGACAGVGMQMKTCTDSVRGLCGKPQNLTTGQQSACKQVSQVAKALPLAPPTPPVSKPAPSLKGGVSPDESRACEYSLYDTHRQKFVFTRWNQSQVMTRSKVKKWCDMATGQYILMTTPTDACRRYYKDLCDSSNQCRTNRPGKERDDFAEGCWRGLVLDDLLPVGLSSKQTVSYFICQRFAAESSMGRTFGSKDTYYGTLYDTRLRFPILSLHKVDKVGDLTWPETKHFVEHGLVEEHKDLLWMLSRPMKGMLHMSDLHRCQDDQSCDVGLRQVLPGDYNDKARDYLATPLIWPELMPPNPAHRLSTLTLTNTAPLHTSLYNEWHAVAVKVREFAIKECGIPYIAEPNDGYFGQMASLLTDRAALYIAAGVIPTVETPQTVGKNINVPFLFWMAGCCVHRHTDPVAHGNKDDKDGRAHRRSSSKPFNEVTYSLEEEANATKKNISSFSVYIQNSEGNHVIAAPLLQLELLLQDMYKTKPSDPEVTLFPGEDGACSELRHDVSRWFQ